MPGNTSNDSRDIHNSGPGDGPTSSSAASEDGLQGYSSSSSSSIYQHPFASFNFGPSTPSDSTGGLASRLKEASLSPKASFNQRTHPGPDQTVTNLNGPPSPAMSFAGSQNSIDEYDIDSPSSLCSWSSFMSGQRGDLADVEDLELGENELETVSELDEDNYSANGSDGPVLESDDDFRSHHPEGLRFGESLTRRRTITQHGGASQHHHLHNHLVGQSGHGLPHFSPRSGGHGLSHHSRWTSRTPASVVARRRKGRIAELAEEGAGDVITGNVGITTTKMPSREAAERSATNATSTSITPPSNLGPRPGDCSTYSGTPSWPEFSGPPALPVRSVSPSETVPVVPSPLCEFISASMTESAMTESAETLPARPSDYTNGNGTEDQQPAKPSEDPCPTDLDEQLPTPTASRLLAARERSTSLSLVAPMARRGRLGSATGSDISGTQEDGSPPDSSSNASFPMSTADPSERDLLGSPDTTPPTSPTQPIARKLPGRSRRSSSPVRMTNKPKMPLRPCFSRRNSTQSGRSTRDSSVERDRGRCHVRFSPAPPQTIRTHSPIEYDRSSCAVHNRLSVEDVEELHKMDMDMGLLAAKCSAIAAITSCKLPKKKEDSVPSSASSTSPLSSPAIANSPSSISREISHEFKDNLAANNAVGKIPGGHDHAAGPERNARSLLKSPSSDGMLSPAEHLRIQREKERERACIMAGIGTGLGGRNLGRGLKSQTTNPLIARFGLTAPPPPLPSASIGNRSIGAGSKSAPTTPYDSSPSPMSQQQYHRQIDDAKSLSDRSRSPRASSLHRTPNEERAMLRSMALSNRAVVAAQDDSETECDEPRASRTPTSSAMSPSNSAQSSGVRGRTMSFNRKEEGEEGGPSTGSVSKMPSVPDVVTTSPSPPASNKTLSIDSGWSSNPSSARSPLSTPIAEDLETPLYSATPHSSSSRAESYFSSRPLAQPTTDEETQKQSLDHQGYYQSSSGSTTPGSTTRPAWSGPMLYPGNVRCRGVGGGGGYDSPGSGFESGSEYDLIG